MFPLYHRGLLAKLSNLFYTFAILNLRVPMKTGPDYLTSSSKRNLDIAGAVVLSGALALPSMISLASAAIDNRSTDPFYRQVRVDGEGVPFTITKLRTLAPGSDATGVAHGTYDPRASKLGTILRRFGLDEIPQLADVMNGNMSLVGVRANSESGLNRLQMEVPALFDTWYEEAYRAGKPALMSPTQLYKRSHKKWNSQLTEEGMRLDLNYVNHASLKEDLKFLGALPLNILVANLQAEVSGLPSPPEELANLP
jgi:lipopolysaccharide/colanic/teichoic acid biosynthesis glycosyltransferase